MAGLRGEADVVVARGGGFGAEMEERSEAVGARRMIFLEERVVRGMEGSAKGGFRMPSLGVIMNFWWGVGIERASAILVARSVIVAESGKVRVCGVPWWMNVMSSVDSDGGELSAVETLGWFSPSVVISRRC